MSDLGQRELKLKRLEDLQVNHFNMKALVLSCIIMSMLLWILKYFNQCSRAFKNIIIYLCNNGVI